MFHLLACRLGAKRRRPPAERRPAPRGAGPVSCAPAPGPPVALALALALAGLAACWSCSDSTYDVCQRAVSQQAACDPNLSASAAETVSACSTQLDGEAPSCREGARRLSDCIAQNVCAELDRACHGVSQVVLFNCSQSPFPDLPGS